MELYVLDPGLHTLGLITVYSSLTHTRQFAGSGSFTLKAPFTQKLAALLEDDNILYWRDAGRECACYVDTVICEQQDGKQVITASGANLRGLLNRRIVWHDISWEGTVEQFARRVVSENCIAPLDRDRVIPLLQLGAVHGLAPALVRDTEHENLEDLLDDLTEAHMVGFDIRLDMDARVLTFEAFEGVDRSVEQREVPQVIVSRDRGNVVSQVYTRSAGKHRNAVLIGGEVDAETEERHYESIVQGSGLARRELYLQAGGKSKAQDDETEAQAAARYRQELLEKGAEKLAAQQYVHSLDCELDGAALEVLDVGDRVTVLDGALNLQMHTHITQITTYHTGGASSRDVTLGKAVPSIYQEIERGLR